MGHERVERRRLGTETGEVFTGFGAGARREEKLPGFPRHARQMAHDTLRSEHGIRHLEDGARRLKHGARELAHVTLHLDYATRHLPDGVRR